MTNVTTLPVPLRVGAEQRHLEDALCDLARLLREEDPALTAALDELGYAVDGREDDDLVAEMGPTYWQNRVFDALAAVRAAIGVR